MFLWVLREFFAQALWGERNCCNLKGTRAGPETLQLCPQGVSPVTSAMRAGLGLAHSLKSPST